MIKNALGDTLSSICVRSNSRGLGICPVLDTLSAHKTFEFIGSILDVLVSNFGKTVRFIILRCAKSLDRS
jgi:hypothetical protein